jgi:hypothetical protein
MLIISDFGNAGKKRSAAVLKQEEKIREEKRREEKRRENNLAHIPAH